MSRVMYIGGFGNGENSAERVAGALSKHYEDVDSFTFAKAKQNPETIRRCAIGAQALSHSAGRMAIVGSQPEYIHAFNSPKEVSRTDLLLRTAKKTAVMWASIRSRQDLKVVTGFNTDAVTELVTHPVTNLRYFLNGDISKFDGGYTARLGVRDGIPEAHISMTNDIYFDHDADDLDRLSRNGVYVVRMAGQHDELVLRPEETLDTYFSVYAK